MRPSLTLLLKSICIVLLTGVSCSAWISQTPQFTRAIVQTTRLHEVVQGPDGVASSASSLLKEAGETIIRNTLLNQGCSDDQFQIEWKADRIIVTVKGSTYLRDDEHDENFDDDEIRMGSVDLGSGDLDEYVEEDEVPEGGTNLVELSRAIRAALDVNAIGNEIAEQFEIEVTTPGAPDELSGIMWKSYKGFDVIVEYFDAKKDKVVFLDARLVERNDENTVVNIKGRMKKLSNDIVKAVRLPKAKKEKGG